MTFLPTSALENAPNARRTLLDIASMVPCVLEKNLETFKVTASNVQRRVQLDIL